MSTDPSATENLSKQKKVYINNVSEIYTFCKTQSKRILIIGDAGMGKSTLCQYIAHCWSKDILWREENKFICWIRLNNLTEQRYPKLSRNYQIQDIIAKEYGSEESNYPFSNIAHSKTIWLLDGYDELPNPLPEYLNDAVEELLNAPYVIVTSRPHQIQNLPDFDLTLELDNLSDEHVNQFILNYFDEEKIPQVDIKNFIEALKKNHHLWELVHTPLLLVLICNIQMHQNVTNLKNQSEIYEIVLAQFLKHYLEKQNKPLPFVGEKLIKVTKNACKDELISLSSLAFTAFQQHMTTLDKNKIEAAFESIPQPNSNFGFWKQSSEVKIKFNYQSLINIFLVEASSEKDQYRFRHTTLQEYFVATHITHALKTKKSLNLYDHENNTLDMPVKNFIAKHKNNPHYEKVWCFVSGILGSKTEKVYLQKFFKYLFAEPHDLNGIFETKLLFNCLEEAKLNEEIIKHKKLNTLIEKIAQFIILSKKSTVGLLFYFDKFDIFEILSTKPHICKLEHIQKALAKFIKQKLYYNSYIIKVLHHIPNLNHTLKQTLFEKFEESHELANFLGSRFNTDTEICDFLTEKFESLNENAELLKSSISAFNQIDMISDDIKNIFLSYLGNSSLSDEVAIALAKKGIFTNQVIELLKKSMLANQIKKEDFIIIIIHSSAQAYPLIQLALSQGKQEVIIDAIGLLIYFGTSNDDIIAKLRSKLKTGNQLVKIAALNQLALLLKYHPDIINDFKKTIINVSNNLRNCANDHLANLSQTNETILPYLFEQLVLESQAATKTILSESINSIIKKIGVVLPQHFLLLQSYLEGPYKIHIKNAAAFLIGKIQKPNMNLSKEIAKTLCQALTKNQKLAVKKTIIVAIGNTKFASDEIIENLLFILKDTHSDNSLKCLVIEALIKLPINQLEIDENLEVLIEHHNQELAFNVIKLFIKINYVTEHLILNLNKRHKVSDYDYESRRDSVQLLGVLASKNYNVINQILNFFNDRSKEVRKTAAQACGLLKVYSAKTILNKLIAKYYSNNQFARDSAIQALAIFGRQYPKTLLDWAITAKFKDEQDCAKILMNVPLNVLIAIYSIRPKAQQEKLLNIIIEHFISEKNIVYIQNEENKIYYYQNNKFYSYSLDSEAGLNLKNKLEILIKSRGTPGFRLQTVFSRQNLEPVLEDSNNVYGGKTKNNNNTHTHKRKPSGFDEDAANQDHSLSKWLRAQ